MTTPRRHFLAAAGLYLLWTAATWALEGRTQSLLRPDAIGERLAYVLIANMLIGTAGALFLLRRRRHATAQDGFGSATRSLVATIVALLLGLAFFRVQGVDFGANALAIVNGYAQTLPVSIAEILVCWCVFGRAIEDIAAPRWLAIGAGALGASVVFGLYHIGHSPPFNSLPMMAFLTVVGLVTSAFFFIARDVYGTIVFHNFAAAFGVVQATGGRAEPAPPLYVMALIAIAIVMGLDRTWLRRRD